MKKLLILFFLFCVYHGFSQDEFPVSIELNGRGIYYFFDYGEYSTDYKNSFNYGFSVLCSKYYSPKTKLSTGLIYSTKNFYLETEPYRGNDYLIRSESRLKYFHVPFLVTYDCIRRDFGEIRIRHGLILNIRSHYEKYYYYQNKELEIVNKNDLYKSTFGLSYRLGCIFSKTISSKLIVNISPFVDYKFALDFEDSRPALGKLPEDRFSCGVNLGVEFEL